MDNVTTRIPNKLKTMAGVPTPESGKVSPPGVGDIAAISPPVVGVGLFCATVVGEFVGVDVGPFVGVAVGD